MILVSVVDSFQLHQMAHVKNVGGGPGDEDPRPSPRLPADVKGKDNKASDEEAQVSRC